MSMNDDESKTGHGKSKFGFSEATKDAVED